MIQILDFTTRWADRTMIEKACEWLHDRIQVDEPKVEYDEDGQPLAVSFFAHAKARCKAADAVVEQFKQAMQE